MPCTEQLEWATENRPELHSYRVENCFHVYKPLEGDTGVPTPAQSAGKIRFYFIFLDGDILPGDIRKPPRGCKTGPKSREYTLGRPMWI